MKLAQNNNSTSPLHGLWALTNRELKKWYKNPFHLLMTIVQPMIWMGLFGKAMNIGAILTNVPTTLPPGIPPQYQEIIQRAISDLSNQILSRTFGTTDYFSFMAMGMLSFVVLFTTMSSGMSIVWDRRLGFLNKVLSTPVPRASILMSKVFSAVIRSLLQAAIVLGAAFLLGLTPGPDFSPLNLIGVFASLFLIGLGLSSFFISIAVRSTRWETQMAVMNLVNLPLLFASNALFPTSMMPSWLQPVTQINPITYATDATRQLVLYSINMSQLIFDFTYLAGFAAIFTIFGILLSWRYLNK
jgi:ABC-2 type transport system permease protein